MFEYQPSDLPFFGYDALSRRTARDLFIQYMDQIPARLAMLTGVVNATPGDAFETWEPDFSPESLVVLGDWFLLQLLRVPISEDDKQAWLERNRNTVPQRYWDALQPPAEDFDAISYALMLDVSIYLGETLRANVPEIEWRLSTALRSGVSYHKPILETTDPVWPDGPRAARQRTCPQDTVLGIALAYVDPDRSIQYLHDVFAQRAAWLRDEDQN